MPMKYLFGDIVILKIEKQIFACRNVVDYNIIDTFSWL